MLNNLSVRTRLVTLIAIPILAFVSLAFVTLTLTKSLVSGVESINNDRVVPLKQIKQVSDHYAVNIVDSLHKYNASLMSKSELLFAIQQSEQIAQTQWQAYLSTDLTQEELNLINESERLFIVVKDKVAWYKQQLNQSKPLASSSDEFVKVLYQVFDPFSASLNQLIDLQLRESQKFSDTALATYEQKKQALIISCVVLVLMASIGGLAIYKSILNPLNSIKATMAKIAHSTDLTLRVERHGHDEFSDAAASINEMLEHFKAIIKKVLSAVGTLNDESDEMSNSSAQVASTTNQQEQQTALIATAVTQMSSAIGEVSSNAVLTSQRAKESDDIAKQGLAKISENIDAINELNVVISNTKKDIDTLSEKSNEINTVVQLIQSVAEQTNLLALNAAIEAARAGESGRGFAVVADEVRQLAHNTQSATEQISDMIVSLQTASNSAVLSMEEASSKTLKSVDIATESATTIESIADAITEISDMNIVVSTATEEQTTVAEEISNNINEFSQSISSINNSASGMATVGHSMSELSTQLKKDISIFTV